MNQDVQADKNASKKLTFLRNELVFFYALILLLFLGNFFIVPAIKYLFFIVMGLTVALTLRLRPTLSFLPIFCFMFFEGQGKMLWSYAIYVRFTFDLVLIVLMLKIIIHEKKIFDLKLLPSFFYFFLALHFFWYFLQFFNIYAVSYFAVLSATKIYILPFLIFLSLLRIPYDKYKRDMQAFQVGILLLLIFESLTAFFQLYMGGESVFQLARHYVLVAGDAFIGSLFRPFGTTNLPGGYSIYLAYAFGLTWLYPIKGKLYRALHFLGFVAVSFSLVISQVRSIMVKFMLFNLIVALGLFFVQKEKGKTFFRAALVITLSFFALTNIDFESAFPDLNLENSIKRLTSLGEASSFTESRSGPSLILDVLEEKLTANPFGLGPGRTGAAAGVSKKLILNDPVYGELSSWAFDNLFVSLAIDLGIGAFFYLMLVFFVPAFLVIGMRRALKLKDHESFRVILVCFSSTLVILVGNWGAISLPYNPDSFMYWFYSAIGIVYVNKFRSSQSRESFQ